MAIEVLKGDVYTRQRLTAAGTAIPGAGLPLKKSGRYAVLCADGDPEIGTDEFLGISTNASTDTASVAGTVDYIEIVPKMVLRGPATPGITLSQAQVGDAVTFDVSNGVFTIDADEGSDPDVHALEIVAVNVAAGTVDVEVKSAALITGDRITA